MSNESADKDVVYEVAYGEAVRALSEQQSVIDSFVGVAVMSMAILWPHASDFGASPQVVIDGYAEREKPVRVGELHRDLSLFMHDSHTENRASLERMAAFFQIASSLLATEVILWVIALASPA